MNRCSSVAIEPDNTKFIEELKNETALDPKKLPDCSRWGNLSEAN